MNVLHVVPTFYPATGYGGPIRSLFGLCNALSALPGVTLRVLTTNAAGPRRSELLDGPPVSTEWGYEVRYCRRLWGADLSPEMLFRLWPMVGWADVVHLTAVYSSPTIPTLLACRLRGKPVVWSTRGALQRWEGSTNPRLKRAWEGVCGAILDRARCVLHATSEAEAADCRNRLPGVSVAVIPNGVDIPARAAGKVFRPEGRLRLLFVGRLHPIKGIEHLLQAIELLGDATISLEIVGNGEELYAGKLRELSGKLGLGGRVRFRGHLDGEAKAEAFRDADVCVMPSFSENFGMVAAEALGHGVPVIAGRGTPWRELEERGCGLWVDNRPESLAEAIGRIRGMELEAMGARGREWMEASCSWKAAGSQMRDAYASLAEGAG